MRILFVVCGEGLGHSSRCIHLGHYLEQHGHSVSYLAYGKSYDFFHDHGCVTVFLGQREVCLEGENGFFSLKKTLWCSRWIALNMIRSALRVRRLIREQRIDCVVCDTMYGGVLAARVRNVPVVFITNQNRFSGPGGRKNPVWETLNFLIRRYLRLADTVIIPDYPPPETVSEYNLLIPERERQHYHFTGPFLDVDLSRYHFGQKTIFTSFGGEPYKLPLYRLLRTIADERKDLIFDVFYTGAVLPESSDNYLSHGYVPNLYEHLAEARIAIVHGGLTTLHEALIFSKPVLIIVDPGHPEQQNNAKRIVDMGAGTAVDGRTVNREILEQKIAETLSLPSRKFDREHAAVNGRKNAAEIIEAVALHAAKGKVKTFSLPTGEQ
ncbi:glycosyltransferase family protein [Methanoregula sp.]|uniref:glycosyltransferase family protein n=1 Tax=Methanoregula sp. TaxID=2052170 RepID=UPI003BAF0FCB